MGSCFSGSIRPQSKSKSKETYQAPIRRPDANKKEPRRPISVVSEFMVLIKDKIVLKSTFWTIYDEIRLKILKSLSNLHNFDISMTFKILNIDIFYY